MVIREFSWEELNMLYKVCKNRITKINSKLEEIDAFTEA